VDSSGQVVITNNKINNQGKMHRIHYAEGNWSGAQLPMDRYFTVVAGTPASAFPPEIVPPGSLQVKLEQQR